jgi:hypothetical protein
VLATVLFLALWVVLGLALFFVAVRGGLGGARDTLQAQTRAGRKVAWTILAIVYVGFGVVLPFAMLSGNRASANNQIGGIRLTAADKRGRELFGEHCGVCHTLAGANAVGKVGPNLDILRPPSELVMSTIANGCLQNPPANSQQSCLGQGNMPSDLVEGRDAQNVANFVAKVAGRE